MIYLKINICVIDDDDKQNWSKHNNSACDYVLPLLLMTLNKHDSNSDQPQ